MPPAAQRLRRGARQRGAVGVRARVRLHQQHLRNAGERAQRGTRARADGSSSGHSTPCHVTCPQRAARSTARAVAARATRDSGNAGGVSNEAAASN
eukprot:scaffold6004_cov282-Prasinococcus_capsulatus_cf.AAC.1